jgi:hypothetical protein
MTKSEIRIAVPKNIGADELESKLNKIWKASELDIYEISKKHGADLGRLSTGDKKKIESNSFSVKHDAAGVDPVTVALLISLEPLIKTLTPILEPLVKSAATVAEKIALDIWAHMKLKLWHDDHIALTEKK